MFSGALLLWGDRTFNRFMLMGNIPLMKLLIGWGWLGPTFGWIGPVPI